MSDFLGQYVFSLYNLAEYMVAIMVTLAFLGSFAIRRSPSIREPRMAETGRNLLVGGWFLLAIRLWYLAIWDTKVEMSIMGLIGFFVLSLGATVMSANRLFAETLSEPCDGCPYKGLLLFPKVSK